MNPELMLEHAERLVGAGPGRPRQADLRRAVSAAYYALFHLLTQEAGGWATANTGLQPQLARTLTHRDMKQVSQLFRRAEPPKNLRAIVAQVPDDLSYVANTLVELQEARHRADYDLRPDGGFTRASARTLVGQVRQAFEAWTRARVESAAEVYLLGMLLPDALRDRER